MNPQTPVNMMLSAMALLLLALLPNALAATAPDVGACASFAMHGHAGVAASGTGTVVNGNVGGGSISGFGAGEASISSPYTIYTAAEQPSVDCAASKATAYDFASAATCETSLPAPNLSGLTLFPGVYCYSSLTLTSGALTLDGRGNSSSVFIFQSGSNIVTSVNTQITLTNCTLAKNVFWRAGAEVTLATDSSFAGTILAYSSISLDVGTVFVGRALASTESVTLAGTNTVSLPPATGPCTAATTGAAASTTAATATTTGTTAARATTGTTAARATTGTTTAASATTTGTRVSSTTGAAATAGTTAAATTAAATTAIKTTGSTAGRSSHTALTDMVSSSPSSVYCGLFSTFLFGASLLAF